MSRRLRWALAISLVANFAGWRAVSALAIHPMPIAPRTVEITRVIIDRAGHKVEKIVPKEQITKRLEQIKIQPPAKTRQVTYHPPTIQPTQAKQTRQQPVQAPVAIRNSVIASPEHALNNGEPTIAPGGNATPGVPVVQQPGPVPVVKQEAVPTRAVDPVRLPTPITPPPPAPPAAKPPMPIPPPIPPRPETPPAPTGPSKEAEPVDEVKPEMPDELKNGSFKSFVRVKVEIDADGASTPILRTSSGNTEVDKRVLDALKRWKWKPALQNGMAVKSTQLFKFEFLVE